MPKQNFTQAEIEEYKRKQQAEMREMTERIEKGVKDVFSSEKYKDYLKFTSKFTNYEVVNGLYEKLKTEVFDIQSEMIDIDEEVPEM